MSGLTTTEQVQSMVNVHPTSEPSTNAGDPAASLRAAALLTLKSKRRKANLSTDLPVGLPPRPVSIATPSIQLDYGQEEPPPSGASSTASSSAVPAPVSIPEPMDVDDDQAREEGEISDSETTPPAPVTAKPDPTSGVGFSKSNLDDSRSSEKRAGTPPRPAPRLASPVAAAVCQSAPGVPTFASPVQDEYLNPPYDGTIELVDTEHVRPGLAMNQQQYDTAKDIVLDLLGWGVPPEYLVNCGLSREIVYWVFVELNLRLPSNLDISDLPVAEAYPPEPVTPSSPPEHLQRAALAPLLPIAPTISRPVQGHPSLPQKPSAPQGTSPLSVLSPAAPPFVPGPSTPTSPTVSVAAPSLLDMEQQRRQELLARKAVLASRKSKQLAAAASSSSVSSADTSKDKEESGSTVAKETVDSFLKSIEPVKDEPPPENKPTTSHAASFDNMDVDEPIPGLSLHPTEEPFLSGMTPLHSESGVDTTPPSDVHPSRLGDDSTPAGQCYPTATTDAPVDGDDTHMDVDRPDSTTPPSDTPGSPRPSRRVAKRPKAADFVDMDPGPSSRGYHSNGYSRHGIHHQQSRKKTSSFAGVGPMRRIVINLSDSEEEELEDGAHVYMGSGSVTPRANAYRGGAAPSTASSQLSPGSNIRSPLREKEEELKRMKQRIAHLEQARAKKLMIYSSKSTCSTPPVFDGMATQANVSIKQEEDDNAASVSLHRVDSQSVELGTETIDTPPESSLPPSATSASSPVTPFDIVQNALEHPITGDRVLTDEARQEQVAQRSSRSSTPEASKTPRAQAEVDVADSRVEASSAQSSEDGHQQESSATLIGFDPYHSPLSWYPLLRSHSPLHFSDLNQASTSVQPSTDTGFSPLSTIDLEPLKYFVISKWLSDPLKRICQYEVPGGGECRDRECEDIHLSRIPFTEPSDEDTAQYLCSVMPVGSQYTIKDLEEALEDIRRRQPNMSFDNRVTEALASLGLR